MSAEQDRYAKKAVDDLALKIIVNLEGQNFVEKLAKSVADKMHDGQKALNPLRGISRIQLIVGVAVVCLVTSFLTAVLCRLWLR